MLTKENAVFLALIIAAVVLAVVFRTTMLNLYGFYEPDGFYYFTAMRAIINNGFGFPAVLGISGWPEHAPIAEAHGMYWLVLAPYALLRGLGVSYYTIMRLMPVLFGILDMFGAYLLSRYLSKDKVVGILSMAFVALSMGNAARTSALVFRGDSFVAFPLIMSLVLLIEVFRQQGQGRKIAFAVAAGIALWTSNLVWSGASFADALFMLSFAVIVSYAFLFRKDSVLSDSKYLLISMAAWYVLLTIASSTHFIPLPEFGGAAFIPIFSSMVLLWAFAYLVSSRMISLIRLFWSRLAILLFVLAAGIALFAWLEPSVVYNVFVSNGFITTAGSFGSTTEELQPPSFQFLFTSFGINLFTSLPTLALATIPSYFNFAGTTNQAGIWTWAYGIVAIALCLLAFAPYMLLQVYDSSGFLGGKARFKFDLSVPLLVIMSYFTLTLYLEMYAIRFNSLVSVPIAVMGAYTIYLAILFGRNVAGNHRARHHIAHKVLPSAAVGLSAFILGSALGLSASLGAASVILGILFAIAFGAIAYMMLNRDRARSAVFLVAFMILLFIVCYSIISFAEGAGNDYLAAVCVVLAVFALAAAYYCNASFSRDLEEREYSNAVYGVSGAVLLYVLYSLLFYASLYSSSLTQADSINPQFLSAMQWLGANSPNSSVVLTLWPDGSVVEAVANRTSVTDSVGSENATRATPFAAWLLNDTADPQFLTSGIIDRPGYLVARMPWLIETQGIYTEANITANESLYGYAPLTYFHETPINSTESKLVLETGPGATYPSAVVYIQQVNASRTRISASLQISQSESVPFGAVSFVDQQTGNYTYVQQGNYSDTNGELLVLEYSSVQRPGIFLNITGAYVFGPDIADSNMIKALFLCSTSSCALDSNGETFRLVYSNSDTRIMSITYNST